MPGVEVSVIAAADEASLGIFKRLLAEYDASLDEDLRLAHAADERKSLAERYADGALMIARSEDAAVGCVIVNRVDPRSAEIKRLYVVPRARGLGAGRALVEAAIAFARDRRYERVVLDTERRRLTAAYALYRGLGFVECDAYGPVDYADPTYMELRLASNDNN